MRNVFQALSRYGWKPGFRRRTSNGDTARMPATFPQAAPTAYFNDSAILVSLRWASRWPTLTCCQSRGLRKILSIACGERHGRKRLESLRVSSETHVGHTRSANAARACMRAGLRLSLAGHMQTRSAEISGSGASCPRGAFLSTRFAWDHSRQHTRGLGAKKR